MFNRTDGLGSITDLTTSAGAVAQSYVYDSFGNIVNQTGSLINPYTYTGREIDVESGLYYYRARYYDPMIGRFLTEDPIVYKNYRLGNYFSFPKPNYFHLYNYVANNPINFKDSSGLIIESLLSEVVGEILGDLVGDALSNAAAYLPAVKCALSQCVDGKVRNNPERLYGVCIDIIDQYLNGQYMTSPFEPSDELVFSCSQLCSKIVNSPKFKKACECNK